LMVPETEEPKQSYEPDPQLESSNQPPISSDEQERLGSHPPLPTLLRLSVGPLISQIVIALYDIVNSLWVSKAIGPMGVEVFGAVFIVEFIPYGFADYLMTSLNIRSSFLYGQKRGHEVSKVFIDFVRVAFIFGLLTPFVVLPLTKVLVKWLGADDKLIKMCYQYMFPTSVGSFFNYIYQMCIGLLQSQGRSFLYGSIQVISFLLNIAFLAITMFWLKLPIWGCTLATLCSQAFPGLILFFCYMNHKLGLDSEFNMFCKKFSPETFAGLRVGVSSLIMGLSYSLPSLMIQKYISSAAKAIGEYDVVIQVFGVTTKLLSLVNSLCIGFSYGFVPATSFAWGAKRCKRVKKLTIHMLWVSTLVSFIPCVIILLWPQKIAGLWNKDPDFLKWAKKMIPPVYYCSAFIGLQYALPGLLQAMQMVVDSIIIAVLTLFASYMGFSTLLYFTNKKKSCKNHVYLFNV